MLKFTDVQITPNPCKAGEKIVISVKIEEIADFPYQYPHKYPIAYEGVALPAE